MELLGHRFERWPAKQHATRRRTSLLGFLRKIQMPDARLVGDTAVFHLLSPDPYP